MNRILAPLLIVLSLAASCEHSRTPELTQHVNENLVEVLWLPADVTITTEPIVGASTRDGRRLDAEGGGDVGFRVIGDREQLSRHLIAHFERLGWCQRKTQFMNPQMATSFEEGWRHQCACILQLDADGKPIPRGELFAWKGEWENSRGDVAQYSFFAEDDRINGYASVTPVHRVRAFQARVGR